MIKNIKLLDKNLINNKIINNAHIKLDFYFLFLKNSYNAMILLLDNKRMCNDFNIKKGNINILISFNDLLLSLCYIQNFT